MNTTGRRGFPPSWSTIKSTEETALQEICWLLLNYCRYGLYTVVVINMYMLQSWMDSVNAWPICSYSKCCLNSTYRDHSVSFPLIYRWFLIFLCHFPSQVSTILCPIFLLYTSMEFLTDSLWWWGDQKGSHCCPWLCSASNQGAINKITFPPL